MSPAEVDAGTAGQASEAMRGPDKGTAHVLSLPAGLGTAAALAVAEAGLVNLWLYPKVGVDWVATAKRPCIFMTP